MIAGFVGFGVIGKILFAHKRSVEKQMTALFNEHKKHMKDLTEDMQSAINLTIYDVNRSMYFAAQSKGLDVQAFDWSLSTTISIIDLNDDIGLYHIWLDATLEHLEKIELGSEDVKADASRYEKLISRLKEIKKEDLQQKIKKVLARYYLVIYTDQPPGDLFEGAAEIPPTTTH